MCSLFPPLWLTAGLLDSVVFLSDNNLLTAKIVRKQKIVNNGEPCDVVRRERMGTAFPHKKLNGSGVPSREIMRDMFLLLPLN